MSPVSRSRKKKQVGKPKRRAARAAATIYPPRERPADVDEPADVLERRDFALPHGGTRIGDEDYPHLDRNDVDDRQMLMLGEHPDLHAIFEDDVRGSSSRVHITMDTAVVNQLWDDDPPEAWEAAQRLRAAGMERLDIIHKIADVLIRHMFPVLKYQAPFDQVAYRADLRSLR